VQAGGEGENLAGCARALCVEALNFLDFFASFLGQAKNEEPVRLEDKAVKVYTLWRMVLMILNGMKQLVLTNLYFN